MRYFEITSGVRLPTNSEERDLIARCADGLAKDDLDERAQEVARQMVTRGLLLRDRNDDKKIIFKLNKQSLQRF